MRRSKRKYITVGLAVTLATTLGVGSQVVYAQTQAIQMNEVNTETATALLEGPWKELPDYAAVAVQTQEWHKKALILTDTETDIYTEPSEESTVIGKAYPNSSMMILEEKDGFTKVSGTSLTGYVKSNLVVTGRQALERAQTVCPQYAVVQSGETSLMKAAAEDGEVKAAASLDNKYPVLDKKDDWIKVSDTDATEVFIKAELVTLQRDLKEAMTIEELEEIKAAEEAARLAAEEAARLAAEEAAKVAAEEAEKAAQKKVVYESTAASSDEQTLLAALIYCEAGNQPYDGQVAVGAVVLNRVRSGRFPNSIREVIYQSGQFGPAITGKLDRVLAGGSYTSTSVQAAADALAGANPIGEALFFGNGNYGQLIGDHYFH